MKHNLTPYDTGEILQPFPWVADDNADPKGRDRDRYGRVDYDDTDGITVCTVVGYSDDPSRGLDYALDVTTQGVDPDCLGVWVDGVRYAPVVPPRRETREGRA